MSRSLERLRETFGDELLIRTGRIYERTVRGERLLRELENLLPRLEALVRGESFDPAQSRERLRVAMTDNASMVLLPAGCQDSLKTMQIIFAYDLLDPPGISPVGT